MPAWILFPPALLVSMSVFSEEIFDPPFINDDGSKRPKGVRGCWGCPCGVEFMDPFADIPPDPLDTEPCPVCNRIHTDDPPHEFECENLMSAQSKKWKHDHYLI
eukprot:Hpha_TRINITY_DN32253_c0_g1::TRINITY_DN32253_c0_g1_i1::g.155225::m.155225